MQPTYVGQLEIMAILDHIVATDIELYETTGVFSILASDHLPIYCVWKKPKTKHDKEPYYGRAYSRLLEAEFVNDIVSHDWSDVLNDQDPDSSWL